MRLCRLGRTGELAALDRTIEVLTEVRSELAALGYKRSGQCLGQGDTGRCKAGLGHNGEHTFPTEAEMEDDLAFQRSLRRLACGQRGC